MISEQRTANKPIQLLELFGGIGSPRCALRNLGVEVKAIDYVEVNESPVASYNAMFAKDLHYSPQTVVGWNLKPDVLVHGSPCQDISLVGKRAGADKGSGTRSSLMWETVNIIRQLGEWKPTWVIWENVTNLLTKSMKKNFLAYLAEMEKMGYTNSYSILDARDFGIPQSRRRVFTISSLTGEVFDFSKLIHSPISPITEFLEDNDEVDRVYDVVQPSVLAVIGKVDEKCSLRRAKIITDCASTITTKQVRTPAQMIDCGNGRYRYLTERECWRLMGYKDEDFEAAKSVHKRKGKYYTDLYEQAGNSIVVPILESIFRKMFLNEDADSVN